MLFYWLKVHRRKKLLTRPFPLEWLQAIEKNVHLYGTLTEDERSQVHGYVQVFVAEKNWEACNGLTMTDEIRVTIAAQVAILTLGLPSQYFDHVLSVLVYPDTYVAERETAKVGGVVEVGDSARLGEAWYRGPVILAWGDVLKEGRGERRGHNVVLHEFAHQLDMLNGRDVDGTPPLESVDQDRRWTEVIRRRYRQLVDDCELGRATPLDCYGATNIAEFFAVATELFFERPAVMKSRLEDLYGMMREFYRQDPAARERMPA
ncbi:MAG: zinc-dependent peptidase [Planctomycetia bacterium]|nr:zinc-dependent peptidase [Planctomycetia bacterium]